MKMMIIKSVVGPKLVEPLSSFTMFETPDQLSLWSLVFRAKK